MIDENKCIFCISNILLFLFQTQKKCECITGCIYFDHVMVNMEILLSNLNGKELFNLQTFAKNTEE